MSFSLHWLHLQRCLPATAACMHLAQQSNDIAATPQLTDIPVTCQGMLPGTMELIVSPVYEAHQTSQNSNGLQALLMTTEWAVRQGCPPQDWQVRSSPASWTAAGVYMAAYQSTGMTGSQLSLLLLLSACLGMDHSHLQLTRTMALVAIVPAALLKLLPLVRSSLAGNPWSL